MGILSFSEPEGKDNVCVFLGIYGRAVMYLVFYLASVTILTLLSRTMSHDSLVVKYNSMHGARFKF